MSQTLARTYIYNQISPRAGLLTSSSRPSTMIQKSVQFYEELPHALVPNNNLPHLPIGLFPHLTRPSQGRGARTSGHKGHFWRSGLPTFVVHHPLFLLFLQRESTCSARCMLLHDHLADLLAEFRQETKLCDACPHPRHACRAVSYSHLSPPPCFAGEESCTPWLPTGHHPTWKPLGKRKAPK